MYPRAKEALLASFQQWMKERLAADFGFCGELYSYASFAAARLGTQMGKRSGEASGEGTGEGAAPSVSAAVLTGGHDDPRAAEAQNLVSALLAALSGQGAGGAGGVGAGAALA